MFSQRKSIDFNACTPLILTECTQTVKKLAMTIEESMEEWRYVDYFSDDSMIAESIIRASKENGTDIDQRSLALHYFQECRALESLWLWEMATRPYYPLTTTRDSKGNVTSVECKYYDEDFDYDLMPDNFKALDQDGFPLVLSFHRHITSYNAKYDPPRLGRTPTPEREERKALVRLTGLDFALC